MRFIATSKDTNSADWYGKEEILRNEALRIWNLQQEEIVRDIWFTQPGNDAILVLECDNLETAQALVADFPLVKAGLIEFQIVQIKPYNGLRRLFKV